MCVVFLAKKMPHTIHACFLCDDNTVITGQCHNRHLCLSCAENKRSLITNTSYFRAKTNNIIHTCDCSCEQKEAHITHAFFFKQKSKAQTIILLVFVLTKMLGPWGARGDLSDHHFISTNHGPHRWTSRSEPSLDSGSC